MSLTVPVPKFQVAPPPASSAQRDPFGFLLARPAVVMVLWIATSSVFIGCGYIATSEWLHQNVAVAVLGGIAGLAPFLGPALGMYLAANLAVNVWHWSPDVAIVVFSSAAIFNMAARWLLAQLYPVALPFRILGGT